MSPSLSLAKRYDEDEGEARAVAAELDKPFPCPFKTELPKRVTVNIVLGTFAPALLKVAVCKTLRALLHTELCLIAEVEWAHAHSSGLR
jgi:hypothetical protein